MSFYTSHPYYLQHGTIYTTIAEVESDSSETVVNGMWHTLLSLYYPTIEEFRVQAEYQYEDARADINCLKTYYHRPGDVRSGYHVPFLPVEVKKASNSRGLWDMTASDQLYIYLTDQANRNKHRYGAVVIGKNILFWEFADNDMYRRTGDPGQKMQYLQLRHPSTGKLIGGVLNIVQDCEAIHLMLTYIKTHLPRR